MAATRIQLQDLGFLTTRGDLLTRGASLHARLAIGTTSQVLGTDGTDAIWAKLLRDNTNANTGTGDTFVFGTSPDFTTDLSVPTIYGSRATAGGLTLRANDDDFLGLITVDSAVYLWPNIPDYGTGTATKTLLDFDAAFTSSPTGVGASQTTRGLYLHPTYTSSPGATSGSSLKFIDLSPTAILEQNAVITGVHAAGTYTNSVAAGGGAFYLFNAEAILQSQTANIPPYPPVIFRNTTGCKYDVASGSATMPNYYAFHDAGGVQNVQAGGTFTVTKYHSFLSAPGVNRTAGTLNVTTVTRFEAAALAVTSTPTITEDVAVEIANLKIATVTTALSLRSAGTAVEMRHAGPARFGSSSAGARGASILDVDGGLTLKRTTFGNANYTALTSDCIIECTTQTANRSVFLPAAATCEAGKVYIIKKGNSSTFAIIVDPNGAETVDSATTFSTGSGSHAAALRVYCTGAAWETF